MGKYMRKAKTAGEVAVMEVPQSTLGVRTRAKTLALQRLQKSTTAPSTNSAGGSYLQLRSRRLEKPPVPVNDSSKKSKQGHTTTTTTKEKHNCALNQNQNSSNSRTKLRVGQTNSGSGQKTEINNEEVEVEEEDTDDLGIEASFGENILDFEGRERSTRESTPCSLIRDPDILRTPGSTTRPTCSMEIRGVQNPMRRHIPTAHEMNEFFADAEEEQQRQFIEKYNYDPVNDKPLPGRFEWEKVEP